MDPEQSQLLSRLRLPARVNVEQAAGLLGFKPQEIPMLVAGRLLKPLGNPAPNAPKFFSAWLLEELYKDIKWLDRATVAVSRHWDKKNSRKGNQRRSTFAQTIRRPTLPYEALPHTEFKSDA